jgi:mono/diheme cytochrome c family protein
MPALTLPATLLLAAFTSPPLPSDDAAKIDFNRQIRPILSENCFACHGPDEKARKAGLRLDTREGAFAALESGEHALVADSPDDSALLFRIEEQDETVVMPPPSSKKALTADQKALLRRWVEQGAEWSEHWAFTAPKRPDIPESSIANPIDAFIRARLSSKGLTPNPEADKTTLIRRATLDLTGLPPTLEEIDTFLADTSPDAYEKLIDRLLQSPHYGEHMARFWLDAARYGDTHGLHLDNYREMWPYRDWVVSAFNGNLPFDQFSIQQLAGDMLENPSRDQKIASGFNRAHVTTSEGGSIDEEVYVRNVVDRVDTTGTVFLGLTIGCARCHDHKFDPIRQKDYYQLFAVLNNCDDKPLDGNAAKYPPIIQVSTPEQDTEKARLSSEIAAQKTKIDEALAKVPYDDSVDAALGEFVKREDYIWVDDALPPGAKQHGDGSWTFAPAPDHPVHSGKTSIRNTYDSMGQHFFLEAQPLVVGEGDVLFAHVFIDPTKPPRELMLQWHSDNWKHRAYWGENLVDFGQVNTTERVAMGPLPRTGQWVRLEVDAAKVGITPGTKITGMAFTQFGGNVYWDAAGAFTWTPQAGQSYDTLSAWIRAQKAAKLANLPPEIAEAIKKDRGERSPEQREQLKRHFLVHGYAKAKATIAPLSNQLTDLEKQFKTLDESIPTTLVSEERKEPRPAFILTRGDYDKRGEAVERGLPAFLPPLPPGQPNNRLGLAHWLVSPEQPLTARVTVNRLWLQLFGTGLVKTAEDFGIQGEPPSHPELLDWLAVDLRETGWDVKRFMKQMLMSETYRQSAKVTPEKLAADPDNRLLSRGPRFRLDAETLRDQALLQSGLLVTTLGGPGVKPPQPAGLWEAVGFVGSNTAIFKPDTGHDKVHRRSLYTFWKRTSPPPQMTTFDAPSREACTVRRERTNTPLQALLLMNEPQYVEAARALAERGLREGGSNDEDRIVFLFRLATARRPEPAELVELISALADLRAHYKANTQAATELINVGETKPTPTLDPAELAAWTMIANTLLNLDETLTKG